MTDNPELRELLRTHFVVCIPCDRGDHHRCIPGYCMCPETEGCGTQRKLLAGRAEANRGWAQLHGNG